MVTPRFLTFLLLAASTVAASPVELVKKQDEPAPVNFHSPPYYPAPKGGWAPTWTEAYRKAKLLVEQMTLAEKVNVTTGIGWSMVCSNSMCFHKVVETR